MPDRNPPGPLAALEQRRAAVAAAHPREPDRPFPASSQLAQEIPGLRVCLAVGEIPVSGPEVEGNGPIPRYGEDVVKLL